MNIHTKSVKGISPIEEVRIIIIIIIIIIITTIIIIYYYYYPCTSLCLPPLEVSGDTVEGNLASHTNVKHLKTNSLADTLPGSWEQLPSKGKA